MAPAPSPFPQWAWNRNIGPEPSIQWDPEDFDTYPGYVLQEGFNFDTDPEG